MKTQFALEKYHRLRLRDFGPLLLAILAAILMLLPGCATTNNGTASSITFHGQVFLSFRDVYDVTHNAYLAHNVRVLDGKVSAKDDADVDEAWQAFRKGYLAALQVAKFNQDAFTPDNVRQLANSVLTLIAATQ